MGKETNVLQALKEDLLRLSAPRKAEIAARFFKSGPNQYGAGDVFLGITVPEQRAVSKRYYVSVTLADTMQLLRSEYHEFRLTALLILVCKYEKAKDENTCKEIAMLYCTHTKYINNWDLVDLSAYKILGPYLFDKNRSVLYDFAHSGNLWKQRIAIITTFNFLRKKDFADTLKLAEFYLSHDHDLIHKASGWMVREIGKRDYEVAYEFVKKHRLSMPRTMLRYAIEKFDGEVRKDLMKK